MVVYNIHGAIRLSKQEFDALHYLANHHNASYGDLGCEIWGDKEWTRHWPQDVAKIIYEIRIVLPRLKWNIETQYRVGYSLRKLT